MAQLMDHVEYLSKEIGPRPAGTEEEQQAALYITEQFQKETGFATNLEEFDSSSNLVSARGVLALVVIVVTVLAVIFPVLAIPAFVLAAAAAAVYALESFDYPLLSRFLSHGASQNVVAKYQPNYGDGSRSNRARKIILVAHYDTGQVTPPLMERIDSFGLPVRLICVGGMVAAAFLALIRIFVAPGGGMGLIVLNVLTILALIVCLLPVVKALLTRTAPYNEGANNNATGTAALLEVARRIARGSVSEADLASEAGDGVRVHGEAAAREAGLVPEGAQIRYEAENLMPPSEIGDYDDDERLLSAKAAIAALTGKPVERRVYGSVADHLVNSRAGEGAAGDGYAYDDHGQLLDQQEGAAPVEASPVPAELQPEPEQPAQAEGFQNAPSWFVAAQQNARKTEGDNLAQPVQVQRSKFTEAFDNAERGRAERQAQAEALQEADRVAALRAREEEVRQALEASTQAQLAARESAAQEAASASPVAAQEPAVQSVPEVSPVAPAQSELQLGNVPSIEAAPAFREGEQDLRAELPSIQPEVPAVNSPSRSGILRKLRTNVPSLSGIIQPVESGVPRRSVQAEDAAETRPPARHVNLSVPSVTEAPSPLDVPQVAPTPAPAPSSLDSSTIAMSPVDYDMEVPLTFDDADSAAAPEPSSVQVPRSRAGNLLDRLRHDRDDDLEGSPQEWLDIEGDFDARSVGKARGSWESFRDDQYFDDDEIDSFGTGDGRGSRWQGGAASRASLGRVNMRSGAETEADLPLPDEPQLPQDQEIAEEIEQIYHFRNPQFNTEIWFVAMGADGDGHDGIKAFLNEHHDELRGSMIIEVESLGAGDLAVASEEGGVRKITASSRVKRFTRNATAATGISPNSVSLAGTDSIASTAQKAGYQAMHLFGEEGGRPALKGSADDVLENVDDLLLDEHVNFIFEMLKK